MLKVSGNKKKALIRALKTKTKLSLDRYFNLVLNSLEKIIF